METIRIRSYIEADGVLRLQMPSQYQKKEVEIVVVIQPLETERQTSNQFLETKKKLNITEIIEGFRVLRQEIPFDDLSIREMIEEGRRF